MSYCMKYDPTDINIRYADFLIMIKILQASHNIYL